MLIVEYKLAYFEFMPPPPQPQWTHNTGFREKKTPNIFEDK